MALVVEDGSGKPDAESYLSEAAADAYHTDHGDPSSWSTASSADKETALRIATQYLDAWYGDTWLGTRTNRAQRLDWPRVDVEDRDGFVLDSDGLPRMLEEATAVAALIHIDEADGLLPNVANTGIKATRVKVGPIEDAVEYVGAKTGLKEWSLLDALLVRLVSSGEVLRT